MLPKSITTEYDQFSKEMKLDEKQKSQVLKRIENAYEEAKISPGEAIGIITAESFGEPSTQMSISYFEKVIVKINDAIKIVEIGKFVDKLIELKGSFEIFKDSEILPLTNLDIYALSLDQDEKVQWKRIVEISRHKTKKKLMKLTTSSGREITATDNHSFVTRIDNKIVPIKGTELSIGMKVPVVNYIPLENGVKVDFHEFIANNSLIETKNGLLIYKSKKIVSEHNSDIFWDEIEKIEYVDSPNEHVYDFSVPGLETFTTFDGIITHNTLNTFHFAGVAEMDITVGLPRLIEIFDARKIPSTPKMEITLKPKFSRTNDMVREVAVRIKETKFGDVVSEFSINIPKLRIEAVMSRKVMRDLGLKPTDVVARLKEKLKTYEVKEDRGTVYVSTKNKEVELSEIYKLKEKVKELHIFGLKGITQVLPVKGENTFVVHCAGSNLKNAVEMDEVEPSNVMTNNLFEIADILGIEAARAAIVNEAEKVIKEQGLEINIRHIMFLADVMTRTGVIKGITRSGITGEKESVLARASFETPIKHIITAALVGETDELNSVVENVMLNQPVPLGTGLPTLIAKVKK